MQKKLDSETARKIEGEMATLMEQAKAQLEEWKVSAKGWVAQMKYRDGSAATSEGIKMVQDWIDETKIQIVSAKDGEVSVVWDISDHLAGFIKYPSDHLVIPEELLNVFKGGRMVEAEDVAKRADA